MIQSKEKAMDLDNMTFGEKTGSWEERHPWWSFLLSVTFLGALGTFAYGELGIDRRVDSWRQEQAREEARAAAAALHHEREKWVGECMKSAGPADPAAHLASCWRRAVIIVWQPPAD